MDDENKQPVKQSQQICSIRIAFPVESDEYAIECKKQISAVLADITQARIEFSLNSMPQRLNPMA